MFDELPDLAVCQRDAEFLSDALRENIERSRAVELLSDRELGLFEPEEPAVGWILYDEGAIAVRDLTADDQLSSESG